MDKIYYTYDSSAHLVSMNLNGVEYYYIRNAQGDIIGLFDKSGTQVVSYTYDTWGKLISIDGSLKDSVGVKNPYRYRGYRYDTETGLYYLQSRYYNPEWARFINADGIIGKTGELLGHNLFAYCKNNPANMTDNSGFAPSSQYESGGDVGGGGGPAIWGLIEVLKSIAEKLEEATPVVEKNVSSIVDKTKSSAGRLSTKIISGIKNSKNIIYKTNSAGNKVPHQKIYNVSEDYKILFRRDFDEFSHGLKNHFNMEIQTKAGNKKFDLHIFVDEFGKVWDRVEKIGPEHRK